MLNVFQALSTALNSACLGYDLLCSIACFLRDVPFLRKNASGIINAHITVTALYLSTTNLCSNLVALSLLERSHTFPAYGDEFESLSSIV